MEDCDSTRQRKGSKEEAIALIDSVETDGLRWVREAKVVSSPGGTGLLMFQWDTGSTFGLGGQIDQIPDEHKQAFIDSLGRWKSLGRYADQLRRLCEFYQAPGLREALSEADAESKLEGKGVAFFKALEDLLRSTWPARCDGVCPAPRAQLGFST